MYTALVSFPRRVAILNVTLHWYPASDLMTKTTNGRIRGSLLQQINICSDAHDYQRACSLLDIIRGPYSLLKYTVKPLFRHTSACARS